MISNKVKTAYSARTPAHNPKYPGSNPARGMLFFFCTCVYGTHFRCVKVALLLQHTENVFLLHIIFYSAIGAPSPEETIALYGLMYSAPLPHI